MKALPPEVAVAPQLAILDASHDVLAAVVVALTAAHPEIDEPQSICGEPPHVWLADAIVHQVGLLQTSLRRYRYALDDDINFRNRRPHRDGAAARP